VGASIVSLTDAIGKTHEAAREAQNTTHETVRTLEQLLEKCESMAPNIESLIAQLDNRIATGSKLKLHVNDELIPEIDNASTRARATAATLLKMLEVVDARSKMAARQAKSREKPVKTAPKRPKSENKSQGLVLPQVKLNTKSHTSASSGVQSPVAEQNHDEKPSLDDSGAKLADAPDSEALCLTGDVLAVLQTDKANIAERMAAVEVREKALATLEAKLSEQMELIDAANDKMEAQLGEMKSLREMNGERAGLIMANMDSRKSYSISAIMASKNARYR